MDLSSASTMCQAQGPKDNQDLKSGLVEDEKYTYMHTTDCLSHLQLFSPLQIIKPPNLAPG